LSTTRAAGSIRSNRSIGSGSEIDHGLHQLPKRERHLDGAWAAPSQACWRYRKRQLAEQDFSLLVCDGMAAEALRIGNTGQRQLFLINEMLLDLSIQQAKLFLKRRMTMPGQSLD
jgi:hypothetical protein